MSSKSIKSLNKYLLSYKDSLDNTQQIGIYAKDAYHRLIIARGFDSYAYDHSNSIFRIQQKFWGI